MKIEIITDLDRLVEVRAEWNRLVCSSSQNCVFLTNEWFCAWYESFGDPFKLMVVLLWNREERLIGAAPLLETEEGLQFIANHEVTDYCDFIVEQGQEALFFKSFLEFWEKNCTEKNELSLISIREESPTLSLLPKMAASFGIDHTIRQSEIAVGLDLPSTYAEYIEDLDRKKRHELRRKIKKLEAQRGLVYTRINDSHAIWRHLDDFIHLHRQSSPSKREFWQKTGMETFFKTMAQLFSAKGWMELTMLSLEENLAAMLFNIVYGDELHFYNAAYDPLYAPLSPGIFLFDRSIRQAFEDKKIRVDFLRGREKYKYNFGAKECKIMDFILTL